MGNRRSSLVGGVVLVLLLALFAVAVLAAPVAAAPGDLDPTFNDADDTSPEGMVFTKGEGTIDGEDVALQADGKIIAVGKGAVREQVSGCSSYGFALARYNADGSLDTSFGPNGNGRVLTLMGNGHSTTCDGVSYTVKNAKAEAVAVQPDGKIVVAGHALVTYTDCFPGSGCYESHLKRIAVARYNSDGSLDTGFGSGGIVVVREGTQAGSTAVGDHETALAVSLQSNGKITLAGYSEDSSSMENGGPFDLVVTRLNAGGGMDASFGSGGQAQTAFDRIVWDDHLTARMGVGVQGDGKVVATVPTDQGFYLVRYNADGSADASFAPEGIRNTNISASSSWEQANDLLIQPDGKIVAAGHAFMNQTTNQDFALVRYNADGSPDASFGDNGIVTTPYAGNSADEAYSLALQPDGKILAAGSVHNASSAWAVARYNTDGSVDNGFPQDGSTNMVLTSPQGASGSLLGAVAVQSDGKVLLTGSRFDGGWDGGATYFALIRLQGGEAPDTTAPTVSLTAPANAATVSGSSVTLSADAADDKSVARVDFYVGAQKVGSDTTGGGTNGNSYTVSWDSTTVADGSKTITARAYDAAGNEKVSASRTVTVNNAPDTTAPTVSLTAPANGATVSGASVPLSASASDNKAVSRVDFYVGTTKVGSDSSAPYSYSWDSRTVADGSRSITARAYDAANNEGVSAARTVTVRNAAPDYIEPEVLAFDPSSGQTGVPRGASVVVEFSEGMDPDSVNTSTVKLHRYDKKRKKWRPVSGAVVSCDAACDTATLDPYGASATLLLASTRYRATVSGATDMAGNFMLLSERSIFTTGTR